MINNKINQIEYLKDSENNRQKGLIIEDYGLYKTYKKNDLIFTCFIMYLFSISLLIIGYLMGFNIGLEQSIEIINNLNN